MIELTGARCKVKVIEDSISPAGVRLTTLQLSYPRFIHAEFMTHRVFSRNASSSRAIPTERLIDIAMEEMVIPMRFGKNKPGMQASEMNLSDTEMADALAIWQDAAETCAYAARRLGRLGLHKQWANRMLEWFSNISVIVTATDWDNFIELRDHEDAQPEIRDLAVTIQYAMRGSIPAIRLENEWHLPYVLEEEIETYAEGSRVIGYQDPGFVLIKASAARCARVSYLNHDGTNPNMEKDVSLHDDLVGARPIHASPVEHQAIALLDGSFRSGNFRGWFQYRKHVEVEVRFNGDPAERLMQL